MQADNQAPKKTHGKIVTLVQGSMGELSRTQWPTRTVTLQLLGVVMVFVILFGVYLGLYDMWASQLVNAVL